MENRTFDQDSRISRALGTVLPDYQFTPHNPGEWIVESPEGNCYLVNETTCTCPDALYRAGEAGGKCKHQIALGHKLLADGILPAPKVTTPARRQYTPEEEAAIERIFTW
jgi:hypothetical protein